MLLLESAYIAWRGQHGPQARKVQSRLRVLSSTHDGSAQTQLIKQRLVDELPAVQRQLQLLRLQRLDSFLLQSGLGWTISKLMILCATMGIGGWLIVGGVLRQTLLTALAAGVLVAALPLLYVSFRRDRRLKKIETQLPDALDLITRALRAGHAFGSGLKMAGDEMAEPISGELRIVHEEVNFGVSMERALSHLSDRVPITDLRYFVVAVLIQRESGGNLTEILTNLSRLIRERHKLLAKVRVLSAEGKMSAWVLAAMPFALAGILNILNPQFISLLWTDPLGISMVKYLLAMMLFGILVMRKIVKIRV
jgi:tight adherence protein B